MSQIQAKGLTGSLDKVGVLRYQLLSLAHVALDHFRLLTLSSTTIGSHPPHRSAWRFLHLTLTLLVVLLSAYDASADERNTRSSVDRLRDVLKQVQICKNEGRTPIVIFDLDDTIFSTRYRTFRIIQEFTTDYSDRFPDFQHALRRVTVDDIGYGINPTLANIGIDDTKLLSELEAYWWDRFFKDDYVAYDLPVPGAVKYVKECYDNGALIYYCTGRHYRGSGRPSVSEGAKANSERQAPSKGMERGTIQALLYCGFPLTSGRAILHLKSSFHQDDAEYKDKDALPKIRALNGQVVATFENEPENANIFLRAFPEAMHFWLQTQHHPEAELPERESPLIRIDDFLRQ